jgi:hypothetical protein
VNVEWEGELTRMGFNDRQYRVFVALGDPAAEPAWMPSKWAKLAEIFDPVIQRSRDRAAVRSLQLRAGPGSPNQRAISFGRIGWNAAGHEKWTASVGSNEGSGVEFMNTEVWAPSWTTCGRQGQAPDAYIGLRNERETADAVVTFNPMLIFAIALDQRDETIALGSAAASVAAELLGSLLRVSCVRPWSYRLGDVEYTNAIGDLLTTGGLFKVGKRHLRPLSPDAFAGNWSPF